MFGRACISISLLWFLSSFYSHFYLHMSLCFVCCFLCQHIGDEAGYNKNGRKKRKIWYIAMEHNRFRFSSHIIFVRTVNIVGNFGFGLTKDVVMFSEVPTIESILRSMNFFPFAVLPPPSLNFIFIPTS